MVIADDLLVVIPERIVGSGKADQRLVEERFVAAGKPVRRAFRHIAADLGTDALFVIIDHLWSHLVVFHSSPDPIPILIRLPEAEPVVQPAGAGVAADHLQVGIASPFGTS